MRKVNLPENLNSANPGLWQENKKGYIKEQREYKLVTPLFGGGAKTRYADEVTTIRPSEIKGQLRFWWRALRSWQAGSSVKKLLEIEEDIWGGVAETKEASKVKLRIEVLDAGKGANPFERVQGKSFPRNHPNIAPAYVAFPLQPTKQDPTIYPVQVGVRFKLSLLFPREFKEEVKAALWAWETFGGIGGRTRRGFGAVVPKDFSPPSVGEIRSRLSKLIKGNVWPEGVPHLQPDSLYLFKGSWQKLVEAYKNFRQWRDEGRERNKPGRSKWPEPDEIRRLTKTHSPRHEPHHPVHKFPRGQFGLPIIFHFKDKKNGDPDDTTLKGENFERLASPLGFKPLGERGPVLVYVLEGNRRLPEPYVLDAGRHFEVDVELTPDEARNIKPLMAAGAEPDPIKAFIKWLEQGGKQ